MLQALNEEGIDILWSLIDKTYETDKIPIDMLVFVALSKVSGTLDCTKHRAISLMFHTLKLVLKIVLRRLRRQLLPEIGDNQFGFMKDRGTTNAIFFIRMLSERAIQFQQDLYLAFIDYQKTFDKVRHAPLFKILKKRNVDDIDLRIIKHVYYQQQAAVRLQDGLTDWFEIKRGVRQDCVISPNLFNLYGEIILRQLEEVEEGFTVNGVKINNIRYANDTALIATSVFKRSSKTA